MKITAEPRSDQWNADDFVSGPRDFVIAGVREGAAEQPYDISLEGEKRCWRPPLTVLRVLKHADVWGDESDNWVGKSVRLYHDPTVRFGSDEVGGIRVSHVSGIAKPITVRATVSRGKRAKFTIEPMPDARPTTPTLDIATTTDRAALKAAWRAATPEVRAQIEARVAELDAAAETLPIEADQ